LATSLIITCEASTATPTVLNLAKARDSDSGFNPSTHPIRGDELRALRKLQREAHKSPFVFVSERGGPFTTDSFNWMVKRAGQKARSPFQVHAHMLRHAAGY
jgi:hypothetical protein